MFPSCRAAVYDVSAEMGGIWLNWQSSPVALIYSQCHHESHFFFLRKPWGLEKGFSNHQVSVKKGPFCFGKATVQLRLSREEEGFRLTAKDLGRFS